MKRLDVQFWAEKLPLRCRELTVIFSLVVFGISLTAATKSNSY